MKTLVLEIASLALLALLAGTAYNRATGSLELLVAADRYPDATACPKPQASADPPAPDPLERQAPSGPSEPDPPPPGGDGAREEPDGEGSPPPQAGGGALRHIGHDETYQMWLDGMLFVDARRTRNYVEGHIPGAVSISAWEPGIGEKIDALIDAGEVQEAPVVAYCTGADCDDSHIVGEQLRLRDFVNVHVYQGGFPDWKARGKEVAVGEEPGRRPQ